MNRVREIRKEKGFTLREIATAAGCSIGFLSDVELNRRGAKEETWDRLATSLGVTVTDLKGDDHAVSDNPGRS